MPVKIGMPMGFGAGLVKEVESPVFSTAVGLVLYAFKHHAPAQYVQEDVPSTASTELPEDPNLSGHAGNIFSRMKEWFEQL
jgi:cell division ATPase FtsA